MCRAFDPLEIMRFLDKHFRHEKTLRALEREAIRLGQARRDTPLIPLECSYQRGWYKTYALDPRVEKRADAPIFRAMLRAVNQRVYSRNREFRSDRGFPIVLGTRRIPLHRWEKLAWPASDQQFFRLGCWRIEDAEFRRPCRPFYCRGYKLITDWWLREDIQPALVTHHRVVLPEVESRLAEIEAFIIRNCGRERLHRLHGRSHRHWSDSATRASERASHSFVEQLRSNVPD